MLTSIHLRKNSAHPASLLQFPHANVRIQNGFRVDFNFLTAGNHFVISESCADLGRRLSALYTFGLYHTSVVKEMKMQRCHERSSLTNREQNNTGNDSIPSAAIYVFTQEHRKLTQQIIVSIVHLQPLMHPRVVIAHTYHTFRRISQCSHYRIVKTRKGTQVPIANQFHATLTRFCHKKTIYGYAKLFVLHSSFNSWLLKPMERAREIENRLLLVLVS